MLPPPWPGGGRDCRASLTSPPVLTEPQATESQQALCQGDSALQGEVPRADQSLSIPLFSAAASGKRIWAAPGCSGTAPDTSALAVPRREAHRGQAGLAPPPQSFGREQGYEAESV